MDKTMEAFGQYGLLGLVLFFIGLIVFLTLKWISTNVIKPMVDSHIRNQDKATDAATTLSIKTAVFMEQMSDHAAREIELMATMSKIQSHLGETLERMALTKDSVELLASDMRALRAKEMETKK